MLKPWQSIGNSEVELMSSLLSGVICQTRTLASVKTRCERIASKSLRDLLLQLVGEQSSDTITASFKAIVLRSIDTFHTSVSVINGNPVYGARSSFQRYMIPL